MIMRPLMKCIHHTHMHAHDHINYTTVHMTSSARY